jgi:hypothetical protein
MVNQEMKRGESGTERGEVHLSFTDSDGRVWHPHVGCRELFVFERETGLKWTDIQELLTRGNFAPVLRLAYLSVESQAALTGVSFNDFVDGIRSVAVLDAFTGAIVASLARFTKLPSDFQAGTKAAMDIADDHVGILLHAFKRVLLKEFTPTMTQHVLFQVGREYQKARKAPPCAHCAPDSGRAGVRSGSGKKRAVARSRVSHSRQPTAARTRGLPFSNTSVHRHKAVGVKAGLRTDRGQRRAVA